MNDANGLCLSHHRVYQLSARPIATRIVSVTLLPQAPATMLQFGAQFGRHGTPQTGNL